MCNRYVVSGKRFLVSEAERAEIGQHFLESLNNTNRHKDPCDVIAKYQSENFHLNIKNGQEPKNIKKVKKLKKGVK